MGDKQRRERLNSYPADLGPGPPHCRKLYERDTGSNLMLCSGWKLILPIFSPLFSCCQEKSSWEQAEDFYVRVYCVAAGPHRMDNCLVSGLDHPGEQRTGCALLHSPFWKSAGRCQTDILRGCVAMAAPLVFSAFCPSTLYPSFGPQPYAPVLFVLKTSCLCLSALSLVSL